jgi:uncharacterized protein (UPF0212 family)
MTERIFLIKCKHCGQQQQTLCRTKISIGYTKCVYCGKLINKRLIIARVKY